MTETEFIAKYGHEWRRLGRKDFFIAFREVVRANSPLKKAMFKSDGDRLNGAVIYFSEQVGWEKLEKLMDDLAADATEPKEPEDTFTEAERI